MYVAVWCRVDVGCRMAIRSNRTHVKLWWRWYYTRRRVSPFWCYRRNRVVLDFCSIFAVRQIKRVCGTATCAVLCGIVRSVNGPYVYADMCIDRQCCCMSWAWPGHPDRTFLFFFCRIHASPSEVSQRGGSASAAQVSSNGLVVRSWSYPVRESPWVLKVTDSSRGLFMCRSCHTVDNDEPAEWIVLVDRVVESRD